MRGKRYILPRDEDSERREEKRSLVAVEVTCWSDEGKHGGGH
jgi:hypothetical protein